MRYVRLWVEILGLSWRHARALTAGVFAIEAGMLVGNIGIALAFRAVVNGLIAQHTSTAVVAAIGAALACTAVLVLTRLHGLVGLFLAVDKVTVVIEAQIARGLTSIEGIEHLERSDFLDRVTVLRGAAARRLVGGMWTAVRAVFTVVQLAATLALLGRVNLVLLLLALLAVAPLVADSRGRRIESAAEIDSAELFRLQRHFFETATDAGTAKEVRVAGVGQRIAAMQAQAWDATETIRVRARVRAASWRALGWTLFVAGFIGALAFVLDLARTGPATIGDVVLVVTLAITLQQTVQTAVGQVTTTMSAGIYIDPFLWLRDYVAADRRASKGELPPPDVLRQGIEFDNVSFTYPGRSANAVANINATLPAGSVVALVGEFGSGKTTLVKLLNRFYVPTSGAIRVDGVDLLTLSTDEWRARTTAAYQDFGRYPQTTFAEAVGIGDLPFIDNQEVVDAAIAAADADSVVHRLPDGRNTRLGRIYGGVDLSEGQWQKTALARSSMRGRPLLLVLDEPTASLDAPSEQAIYEHSMSRARELGRETGTVTVIVSHRLSTVAGADLVLVLDQGRIVERGNHDELMALNGRYAELYSLQANAYRPSAELAPEERRRGQGRPDRGQV